MEIKLEPKMQLKMKVDTRNAAKRIVQVLHEEGIPFSLFDRTFQNVKELAEIYTIPYSPIALEAASLANCASKDKETEEAQE